MFEGLFDEGDVLDAGEPGIESFGGEELLVSAAFDDFAMVQDEDRAGMSDGAEAMSDDEAGAAGHESIEGLLDEPFGGGIHAGGGLVEDKDGSVAQEGACDADPLFFADAQFDAAFADAAVVTLGEADDEIMAVDR